MGLRAFDTATSRLVFTDEAALRQSRSGRMTRYRKQSGRLGTPDEIAKPVAANDHPH